MALTIDDMATFCRRKGFVFPSSEIYGGLSGMWDYGPLGCEVKNNLKQHWWRVHVHNREDMVGIDGAIVSHKKIWEASGHAANFADILVSCTKCNERYRADTLVEDVLKIRTEGLKAGELDNIIKQNKVFCPKCKGALGTASAFNLMFTTHAGPSQGPDSLAYLRPETAQLIFADFKHIVDTSRVKLPFGVAQMGRAFRNEISPRNFLFRCREFEQMEIEYFIHPDMVGKCPYIDEMLGHRIQIWSADAQKAKQPEIEMTIKEALDNGIIKTPWIAFWVAHEHRWFSSLGVDPKNLRARQHVPDELSHYSSDTWDLEYNFPFGWKELQGFANRGDFDLQQHIKHSGQQLTMYDEENKKHIVPHVVCEPSQGVDRAFLVFMFDAYTVDPQRDNNVVLRLSPALAPIKIGVFPLVNKLEQKAREVFGALKTRMVCQYDKSGSVGRRYARADEIGVPFCVTVDFDTLEKNDVTVRDRDTTKQIRVPLANLAETLQRLLAGEVEFEKAGTPVA
jgi:glycyl-tRNA synthetase